MSRPISPEAKAIAMVACRIVTTSWLEIDTQRRIQDQLDAGTNPAKLAAIVIDAARRPDNRYPGIIKTHADPADVITALSARIATLERQLAEHTGRPATPQPAQLERCTRCRWPVVTCRCNATTPGAGPALMRAELARIEAEKNPPIEGNHP